MSTKRLLQRTAILAFVTLLVTACGATSIPAGTIRGVLVGATSKKPIPVNYVLMLAAESTTEEKDKGFSGWFTIGSLVSFEGDREVTYSIWMQEQFTASPDGVFVLSNIPPGRYFLILWDVGDLDKDLLGSSPGLKMHVLQDKNGNRLIVDLMQGKGVDLGEIPVPGK